MEKFYKALEGAKYHGIVVGAEGSNKYTLVYTSYESGATEMKEFTTKFYGEKFIERIRKILKDGSIYDTSEWMEESKYLASRVK